MRLVHEVFVTLAPHLNEWQRRLTAAAEAKALGRGGITRVARLLFSHISMNWRGRLLVSHEVVVELISTTTTRTGLTVRAELDRGAYPTQIQSIRRADGTRETPAPRIPWAMELHHLPCHAGSRPISVNVIS